jgi:Sulfate permease family
VFARLALNRLSRDTLPSGLMSGFATGLFSIPEGMAYGQLVRVNPLYGLAATLLADRIGPENVFAVREGITESPDEAYRHALPLTRLGAHPGRRPSPTPREDPS